MGIFDFDGSGSTDTGEQFIGHQIYKDVTGGAAGGGGENGDNGSFKIPAPRVGGKKLDGFTIFLMVAQFRCSFFVDIRRFYRDFWEQNTRLLPLG